MQPLCSQPIMIVNALNIMLMEVFLCHCDKNIDKSNNNDTLSTFINNNSLILDRKGRSIKLTMLAKNVNELNILNLDMFMPMALF